MFTWTTKASPPAVPGVATTLLTHLTGAFAPAIAGLWPQPHAVFVTAEADRRHLVCLALTEGPLSVETADGLLHWPLRRAVKVALPDAPDGLARALSVLGEAAWTADQYRSLLLMLADPQASKRLRHAATITPALVATLADTPLPLLRSGIDRLDLTETQMTVVREAFDIIAARDGPIVAASVATRWGAAKTHALLRERIADALTPPMPSAPLAGTDRLRPLATKAAMREAAGRYHNCLASQIPLAVDGDSAFFECSPPPGAIVQVSRDGLRGWVLSQARGPNNHAVTGEVRAAICAELASMGVHVGRNSWALSHALDNCLLHNATPYSVTELVADCFGD
jgi:hypothetical protein